MRAALLAFFVICEANTIITTANSYPAAVQAAKEAISQRPRVLQIYRLSATVIPVQAEPKVEEAK